MTEIENHLITRLAAGVTADRQRAAALIASLGSQCERSRRQGMLPLAWVDLARVIHALEMRGEQRLGDDGVSVIVTELVDLVCGSSGAAARLARRLLVKGVN